MVCQTDRKSARYTAVISRFIKLKHIKLLIVMACKISRKSANYTTVISRFKKLIYIVKKHKIMTNSQNVKFVENLPDMELYNQQIIIINHYKHTKSTKVQHIN